MRIIFTAIIGATVSLTALVSPTPERADAKAESYAISLGEAFTYESCWQGVAAKAKIMLQVKVAAKWKTLSVVAPARDSGCPKTHPWASVHVYTPTAAGTYNMRVLLKGSGAPFTLVVNALVAPPVTTTAPVLPLDSVAVVSLSCGGQLGIAVPLAIPEEAKEYGAKTALLARDICPADPARTSSWKNTSGKLTYKGKTYPVYANLPRVASGLAIIYAPIDIPRVKSFVNGVATQPRTGLNVLVLSVDINSGAADTIAGTFRDGSIAVADIVKQGFVFDENAYLLGFAVGSAVAPGEENRAGFSPIYDRYCGAVAKCFHIWKQ